MGAVQDDSAWEAARAAHYGNFVAARAADNAEAMAAAALGLASLQRFGGPGGRTPALLHEAYLAAADSPATRARLAASLARSWVYGNDAARGASFAVEAVELAEQTHDPTVLADALDGQLAASWGPDDLSERLHITARLQDVAGTSSLKCAARHPIAPSSPIAGAPASPEPSAVRGFGFPAPE